MMHWFVAVKTARNCLDVTYDEWCALYVNTHKPTELQIDTACAAAHPILVRNKAIVSSVVFDKSIR